MSVQADVLWQEARQSFKEAAWKMIVAIFPYANEQRQTHNEADGFLCVAVNESGHAVELPVAKQNDVTAIRMQRINPCQQVRDSRRRICFSKRHRRKAKETNRRGILFS